jgi:hypothetical protein
MPHTLILNGVWLERKIKKYIFPFSPFLILSVIVNFILSRLNCQLKPKLMKFFYAWLLFMLQIIQEQRDSGGNAKEEGELTEATLWV